MGNKITELVIPIKETWFNMILSGKKTEEYREIKPYWTKRFQTIGLLDDDGNGTSNKTLVTFRNGYGPYVPYFRAWVYMKRIGFGHEEWGAEPEHTYYVIGIDSIAKVVN